MANNPFEKRNDSLTPTRVFSMEEIGAILRLRRKELGYTQEYIASLMGTSPRLIGEIERGRESVGIQKVLDLTTGLGIDITLCVRSR
ncbi:MAG: helix-turn-helix transcriptional regulator [Eggerthellaceae bacterium]|jgi:DNA-binding XRE family transcriptional regulator|nr:helix-turn-helix transcriptional regulator [Eggerthellaceae bacterium]MDR2721664.1 helix-turn-helix transcriptional regulator [Coriobacteriaceae bacterium]